MSSGLQNKMYNLEIPPPQDVWKNIVHELDESSLSYQFPSTLQAMQVTPPQIIWRNIEASLDEGVFISDWAQKLLTIEVSPPVGIWNKIEGLLKEDQENVIPEQRKISPLFRYAAAAIILAAFAWGGIRLLNNNNTNNTAVNKPLEIQPQNNIPAIPVPPQDALPVETNTALQSSAQEDIKNTAALEVSKKTYAKLDNSSTKLKIAREYYFTPGTGSTRGLDEIDYYSYSRPVTSSSGNRYITLMTPEGNIIRMAKKLGDLVYCVSGLEQDEGCINQVKKWQEKIANAPSGQSPDNFMDIFNLVNSLQNSNDL